MNHRRRWIFVVLGVAALAGGGWLLTSPVWVNIEMAPMTGDPHHLLLNPFRDRGPDPGRTVLLNISTLAGTPGSCRSLVNARIQRDMIIKCQLFFVLIAWLQMICAAWLRKRPLFDLGEIHSTLSIVRSFGRGWMEETKTSGDPHRTYLFVSRV